VEERGGGERGEKQNVRYGLISNSIMLLMMMMMIITINITIMTITATPPPPTTTTTTTTNAHLLLQFALSLFQTLRLSACL